MQWLTICVLSTAVYGGGGVTKTSGVEQFWTDDYKIFDQVYGKTSDKEIYGATLPPSINFNVNTKKTEASEKKERFLINYQQESDVDPYNLGYNNLLTKPLTKPAKSANFVSYNDFKPISQSNDPGTYNYLKYFEFDKQQNIDFPKGVGGFKPYSSYSGSNPEDSDAHRSIQDILDAHEANKMKTVKQNEDVDVKYLGYGKGKRRKPSRVFSNDISKTRCLPGRCRKRSTPTYRVRSTRPYYRRIKHRSA